MRTPAPAPAEPQHPATVKLLEQLDELQASAPHEPDPRAATARLAGALAEYFRTPD